MSRLSASVAQVLLLVPSSAGALCPTVQVQEKVQDVGELLHCTPALIDLSRIAISPAYPRGATSVRLFAEWEKKEAWFSYLENCLFIPSDMRDDRLYRVPTGLGPLISALETHSPETRHMTLFCGGSRFPVGQTEIDLFLRDRFPLQTRITKGDVGGLTALVVTQPVQADELKEICTKVRCPQPRIPLNLRIAGGDLVSDGRGSCLTTDRSLADADPGTGRKVPLPHAYRSFFGCDRLFVLRALPDITGHVDVVAKILPPGRSGSSTVLLGRLESGESRNDEDAAANADLLRFHGYQVDFLAVGGRHVNRGLRAGPAFLVTAYPNAYVDGRTVYVPQFEADQFSPLVHATDSPLDLAELNRRAVGVYKKYFERVVTVASPWIVRGGGPHCVTAEFFSPVPARP
ncbi:MAG: agmatine deiminase family protein [Pseudomonadota bacterium]